MTEHGYSEESPSELPEVDGRMLDPHKPEVHPVASEPYGEVYVGADDSLVIVPPEEHAERLRLEGLDRKVAG